jgi:hypothetical protein
VFGLAGSWQPTSVCLGRHLAFAPRLVDQLMQPVEWYARKRLVQVSQRDQVDPAAAVEFAELGNEVVSHQFCGTGRTRRDQPGLAGHHGDPVDEIPGLLQRVLLGSVDRNAVAVAKPLLELPLGPPEREEPATGRLMGFNARGGSRPPRVVSQRHVQESNLHPVACRNCPVAPSRFCSGR